MNIPNKLLAYLKIFIILAIAYGLVLLISSHILVNYSPTVRKDVFPHLKYVGKQTLAAINIFDKLGGQKKLQQLKFITQEDLQNAAVQIAPGVRASTIENNVYMEYDDNNVRYTVVEYKGHKIRVPEASAGLPPQ